MSHKEIDTAVRQATGVPFTELVVNVAEYISTEDFFLAPTK